MWRTHSCVQRSHACERIFNRPGCRHEYRHGTHECVRHNYRLPLGSQHELGAATAIYPDATAVPAPRLALAAWCAADLARQLYDQTARIHFSIDALAVVRRASNTAAAAESSAR